MLTAQTAMAFMALAFTLLLTIIRTRTGPVVMIASGNGRNTIDDHVHT